MTDYQLIGLAVMALGALIVAPRVLLEWWCWLDRRNDEQPDAIDAHFASIPRDLQGHELPDFDALFASITARIDEEGTA